jgi:hypothetical protein
MGERITLRKTMYDIWCQNECPVVLIGYMPKETTECECFYCAGIMYVQPNRYDNLIIPICDHGFYVCPTCYPKYCDFKRGWNKVKEIKGARVGSITWL